MNRLLLSLGLTVAVASTGAAQPVPPGGGASRPTFSPYLSLANGGNPGANYFGIVRPQQQMQRQINQNAQQFQQSTGALQQELNGLAVGADPNLPSTGQVARFNSLAPYYTRHPVTGAGGTLRSGGGGGAGGFNTLSSSFAGAGGGRQFAGGAGGAGGGRGTTAPRGGAGGVRR